MFLSNSRIEKNNNILFYEQDLLIDNHIYTNNIDITVKVDYHQPGFGIALIANESNSLNKNTSMYLYKIGCNDYSLIRKELDTIDVIDNGSLMNIKPFIENMIFRVKRQNNRLYLYINNEEISSRYMPTNISSYMVGYYSNAGNIIKNISIASSIPQGWNVNMSNTNGGYINFNKNMFTIEKCNDIAEIEQSNLILDANTENDKYYYLKYVAEPINGELDIKAYIFKSDDDRYNVEDKNILDKNNRFKILKDENLTLRFEGKNGIVKDMQITTNKDDLYTGTDYDTNIVDGSYIKINTENLIKIEVEAAVIQVPIKEDIFDIDSEYAIIQDSEHKYTVEDLNIELGKESFYQYTLLLGLDDILKIKNESINRSINMKIRDYIYIFSNVDAKITKLILYKKDGTIIDIIIQDTKKHYVPISVKTPILVMHENGEPLLLSSSYRIVENKSKEVEYIFTNVEREVFEASNRIYLNYKISEKIGSIKLYCILNNSDISEENLMKIDNNINDIHYYCNNFDTYNESDLYSYDKELGTITICDNDDFYINNKYKKIIVDYMKKDSYCLNYKHDSMNIEVDISSKEAVLLRYDITAKNGLNEIQNYKLLDTDVKNNSYIVIKGR